MTTVVLGSPLMLKPSLVPVPVTVLVTVLAATLTPSSAAPASPASPPARAGAAPGDRLDLPRGFQPEGIATVPGADGRTKAARTAWLGSRADGDILALDLRTGRRTVLARGPGTPSIGLKADGRGRLFVAGGPAGTARVVSTRSGETLRDLTLTEGESFVNDVVLTDDAAWFTDSAQPQLYRLARSDRRGPAREATTLPLSGDWVQGEDFGANGITETPDGRALLVVHSTTGDLHRVDPESGETTVVDLGGLSLVNGDGMLLDGRRLHIVQNRKNKVTLVDLNRRGTRGAKAGTIRSRTFDVPTTVALAGDSLFLPNARFTTEETEEPARLRYWVSEVRARS